MFGGSPFGLAKEEGWKVVKKTFRELTPRHRRKGTVLSVVAGLGSLHAASQSRRTRSGNRRRLPAARSFREIIRKKCIANNCSRSLKAATG
jgi:hypothetical protein